MREVFDPTGRFRRRPHFEPSELEAICEDTVHDFLLARHGEVRYPVVTDDLCVLIEQRVHALDLFADLASEGEEVEGATYFRRGARPDVAIAAYLSEEQWRENRFRTTLSHELGHVVLHGHLWALEAENLTLFETSKQPAPARCFRANLSGPRGQVDWMEWQAGFACGAFLMPASELRRTVSALGALRPPLPEDALGREMIDLVRRTFAVSSDASRVRLLQAGHLARQTPLQLP